MSPGEQGIAETMVDVYRAFAAPLTEETLFAWHTMVMRGRNLMDIRRYRTGDEPMQVVSGSIDKPRVHFEALPSSRVPAEMDRFIAWFNGSAAGSERPLPALTRAGIAHLYFESIHPFEDGNGRIGRAFAEKSLSQALGQPALIALSTILLARRSGYYAALQSGSASNEITGWLIWFVAIALEAQRRAGADPGRRAQKGAVPLDRSRTTEERG